MVGDELLSLMKNRVPRVASAVVAEDMRVFLRLAQKVRNLALSAISVLEIYDDINV